MSGEPTADALENHSFLPHLPDPEGDAVDIRVYASPDVLAHLGAVTPADEYQVVQATAAYLRARQRADEPPSFLELDDVAAAYEWYIEELRGRLGIGEQQSGK